MKSRLLLIGILLSFVVLFSLNYDTLDTYLTVTVPMKYAVQETDYLGEYHYDPVDNPQSGIGTVSSVRMVDENYIEIQFTDNSFFVGSHEIPEFEHTETIKKGDVFVETCLNFDSGVSLGLLKYIGVEEYDGKDHYKFFRTNADTDKDLQCKYPQVIIESLKLNWDITMPQGKILTIVLEE